MGIPNIGRMGLGWEIWCDGMEVSQYTYFQQVGGFDCSPVTTELTYGLERLAMYVQGVENVYDLKFSDTMSYGEIYHQAEVNFQNTISNYQTQICCLPTLTMRKKNVWHW